MARVLSDDEIAGMSVRERRELIKRLAAPVEEIEQTARWLMRTREIRMALLVVAGVLMVPWIVYLGFSLPRHYVAHDWDATWVGFDVLLLVMIAATVTLAWLRRQLVMLTSFALGILLVCDAWFDIMTSNPKDYDGAVISAVVIELPLAALLIASSLQMLRLVAARLWSLRASEHAWQIRIPMPSDADKAVSRRQRVGSDA